MVSQSTLWVATAILAASTVDARVCRYYNGQYYDQYGRLCRRGLSTGARIAIGVCVGVGVLLIFALVGCLRRKKLQQQWKQYRPPPPVGMAGAGTGSYSNAPPPPTYVTGGTGGTGGYGNSYSADTPAPPPATYQPSAANNYGGPTGQHGLASGYYGNDNNPSADAQHSYEYEQQARMDAEKGNAGYNTYGNNTSPPGYDATGGGAGSSYAAPAGAPPGTFASPQGPPPK